MITALAFFMAAVSACSATSRVQIGKAVGYPVEPGVERVGPSHTGCDYDGTDGRISIEIHDVAVSVTLEQQRDALKAAFPRASFEAVTVGTEKGFLMRLSDEAAVQLHVLTTSRAYVIITLLGQRAPDAERRIVRQVLGSLFPRRQ